VNAFVEQCEKLFGRKRRENERSLYRWSNWIYLRIRFCVWSIKLKKLMQSIRWKHSRNAILISRDNHRVGSGTILKRASETAACRIRWLHANHQLNSSSSLKIALSFSHEEHEEHKRCSTLRKYAVNCTRHLSEVDLTRPAFINYSRMYIIFSRSFQQTVYQQFRGFLGDHRRVNLLAIWFMLKVER